MRHWSKWSVLLLTGCRVLLAQPECAPAPEVRLIIQEKLAEPLLDNMKFAERVVYRRRVLEDLIAEYRSEAEPYRRLIQATREDDSDGYANLADRFEQQAEQGPRDPVALYAAGLSLARTNTPLSIRFLEQARAEDPGFGWPALELSRIYGPGTKRADAKKSSDEIAAFFAACPSSADPIAQSQLSRSGTSNLQLRVATAMRARLEIEIDPHKLVDYASLWSLEFRAHSPADYPALRSRVAADVRRLTSLNTRPDADWLVFLKDGYQLSGASTALAEDRVIREFPHSDQAYRIVRSRWEKVHKDPQSGKDSTAWAKYHNEYRSALKMWLVQFTDSRELQQAEPFYAALYDPDMPESEGVRALNNFLRYMADYQRPAINDYLLATWMMEDHNWQPSRVFKLLQDSDKLIDQWHRRMLGDNLSAEAEDNFRNNEVILRQSAASRVLVAARLAEQPDKAERLRPFVERELPAKTWPKIEVRYWLDCGRLAMLEGRKSDALLFYQKALQIHNEPDLIEGRLIDDLADEARALGINAKAGGTFSDASKLAWQKPAKPLPAFELTDLSGKIWRLKDLGGQVVLINVWATWCGPCQRELPKLQALYKLVKARTDLQILTMNIDTEPGVVAAFLKEKGYTFPVLPASTFVAGVLDLQAVPQNWILDRKGEWIWTGSPIASEAEWQASMLRQLESVK